LARVTNLPDLTPAQGKSLLGNEIGTQFDFTERMFGYFGKGEVFDYSTWSERDMRTMLLRDGQAAALEAVLTLPIRQASWAITATKGDKGEAEFANSVLNAPPTAGGMRTPMQLVVGQATAAQIYKKAFFEKVWQQRQSDGKITYDKIAYRPPSTCEVRRKATNADFDGFRQQVWMFGGNANNANSRTPGYVDIPKQRSFVYIHGKHREPLMGVSELDLCYWCYKTKVKLLYLWYNFLEQQSLPKVVVWGQDQPEADDRADDIASMRASGIVGWKRNPSDLKPFDIIQSDGKGADQFQAALAFLETWQTSSVLAGFTGLSSLASMGRGSLALSQDQSAFFLKSREGITAEMQTDITHDVVSPLVAVNFGPNAAFPEFKFGPLVDENAASLVTLFQTLAVAPSLQIPSGIIDLLTERLATVLEMDTDAVHEILEDGKNFRQQQMEQSPLGQTPGAGGVAHLAGAVDAATKLAMQHASQQANPENLNTPYDAPQMGESNGAAAGATV
jgi:hypothetical protein